MSVAQPKPPPACGYTVAHKINRNNREAFHRNLTTLRSKHQLWFGKKPGEDPDGPKLRTFLVAINEIQPNIPGKEFRHDPNKKREKPQVTIFGLTDYEDDREVFDVTFDKPTYKTTRGCLWAPTAKSAVRRLSQDEAVEKYEQEQHFKRAAEKRAEAKRLKEEAKAAAKDNQKKE